MAVFTIESLQYLSAHHGVASLAELQRRGLSRAVVRRLVEADNLVEMLRGVYRIPTRPLDELARCAAVCAAHPDLVISGPTAGRLWGLRKLPRDDRVHVIAPPASRPTVRRWVVPYRTAAISPEDLHQRHDGIVVTGRARTALDLARSVGATDLVSIIEQVMNDGSLSEDDLRAVAVDWISPQRPWIRRYLELLDGRLPGGPAESHGEMILGRALDAAGLVGLERQYRVDLPGYGPARFDLAVPAVRLAIEVDLHPTHHQTAGRTRDAARDAAAGRIDWSVERVVEFDFGANLAATVQRVLRRVAALRATNR